MTKFQQNITIEVIEITIHVWSIYLHLVDFYQPNVGKYTISI